MDLLEVIEYGLRKKKTSRYILVAMIIFGIFGWTVSLKKLKAETFSSWFVIFIELS